MPVYVFKCRHCQGVREVVESVEDRNEFQICSAPGCGGQMQRDYPAEHSVSHVWKPGWWSDIDKEPLWIESKQQLFRECDKRGLKPWGYDKTLRTKEEVKV